MAQTELSKQIKRINERYNALARKGYIESEEFEKLTSIISAMPHHELKVKSYNPITEQYTERTIIAISNVTADKFQPMQLKKLERTDQNKKLSVGQIHKNARKLLKDSGVEKPTNKQVAELAFKGSSVHSWIKTYKFAIYGYINEAGEHELYDAVKRSSQLTPEEVNLMFEEIINASKEKRDKYALNYTRNNPDFHQ